MIYFHISVNKITIEKKAKILTVQAKRSQSTVE